MKILLISACEPCDAILNVLRNLPFRHISLTIITEKLFGIIIELFI